MYTALREHPIGHYFRNSLFVARLGDPAESADLLAGRLQLRQVPLSGRNLLFGTVLATMMIPLASMIIPLFIVVKRSGLG